MQDAKILSKKDIVRFQKAVDRLNAIAVNLIGDNGSSEEPVKKRRRRRRKAAEVVEESQD